MIGIEPLVNSTGVSCLQAVLSFGMCESAWNYDYSASSILFRLTTTTHPHPFRSSTHPCRINSLFLAPLPNLFWSNLHMSQQDQSVLKFPFSLIIVHSGREFLIAQLHSLESILGISLSTWGRDGGIEVKLQEKEKKKEQERKRDSKFEQLNLFTHLVTTENLGMFLSSQLWLKCAKHVQTSIEREAPG